MAVDSSLVHVNPSDEPGKFFWCIPSLSMWSTKHFDTEEEARAEAEQILEERGGLDD